MADTGEFYTYVSTQGAKRTVASYVEVEPPPAVPDMTREEFVALLKQGTEYTVAIDEKQRCLKGCFQGKRRGKGNDFGENPDQWFKCSYCSGGFTTSNVTYKVIWIK